MIIRSGLIRNRDDVPMEEFQRHWLNVHGPLARVVPELRTYTQNHVRASLGALPRSPLQRVDGISQLWFDDVASMVRGMDSPEQQACVEDIKGFLDQVTLVIQTPGKWARFGVAGTNRSKVMAVLSGDRAAGAEYQSELCERFARLVPGGGSLRVNAVIDRGHIVDRNVQRGADVVDAIAELHFYRPADISESMVAELFDKRSAGVECLAAVAVEEFQILTPTVNDSYVY